MEHYTAGQRFLTKPPIQDVVGTKLAQNTRPDTTLEAVRSRLHDILGHAEVNFGRVARAGDRAFGAEISGVGCSPEKSAGPASVVDEIFSLLSRLDAVNSATAEQVERIERLV